MATGPTHAQPATWAGRLCWVRGFARYANAVDPRHQIPPQGLIADGYRRQPPYIYSDREITDLIEAARELPGTTGLRPFTYTTLLALLAVTGMRTSEILNLDRDDVDLANGVLTVRNSKFGKSRHIPLHESTTLALGRFAARRDRLCPAPRDPAFFLNESGTRITDWTLRWTFVRLSPADRPQGTSEVQRTRPPASLTCATRSPSARWCGGTGRASMSNATSRAWRPGSAMPV